MLNKLLAAILLTVVACCSPQGAANDLSGLWRGELELQPNFSLVIGLNVADDTATLASPNQGMLDHPLSSFAVDGKTITFAASELNISFTGERQANQIVGTFTQGQSFPLTLRKLTTEDIERLAFEGQYDGALKINGKDLPLQVNIAVVSEGYVGTLDSPTQQTFGLALSDFIINEQQLSFASPLLQANYQGERVAEAEQVSYTGLWLQGRPLGLTLTKRGADTPAPTVELPTLGEHGGAYAVITPTAVEQHYYAEHGDTTQYEIGSVSKTFIAYLLAQAALEGKLSLTTPLQSIIAEAPQDITLESLATHTSGLPRLPADLFTGANGQDPYAHYDLQRLRAALKQQQLGAPQHQYSNYGVGALGEALALAYERSLSDLLTAKVFQPMAMADTYLATPGSTPTGTQLAVPHDSMGGRVAPWHFQALAGAGAIVSTLPDMVRYVQTLQQQLQQQPQLASLLLTPRTDLGQCCEQALGWLLETDAEGKIFAWHNGQTAGFSSYVGFYLDGSRAVVVLNNQATDVNTEAKRLLTQANQAK